MFQTFQKQAQESHSESARAFSARPRSVGMPTLDISAAVI